ncbi:MAG TPA: copper chaperone PCu(A)C [Rhizomicrobium sp.]
MHSRFLKLAAALLAGAFFIQAASLSVMVSQPYLRLATTSVPAAGYFNITNYASEPAVLTGAQSFDCGAITLHRSSTGGGMARMEDVASVTIARGQRIAFAPGGYHLMCERPSPRLRVGGTTKITLKFQSGATTDITFYVVNARGGT